MQCSFPLVLGRLLFTKPSPQARNNSHSIALLTASISSSVRSGSSEEQFPTSGMSGRRRRQRQARSKEVDVQSLVKRMRKSDSQSTDSPASLKDVLAGIKFHVPPNEVTRRRLGIPPKSPLTRSEKEVARLRSERLPENSIFLSDGPRLRVFSEPGPDTQLLPPAPPNIAEREHAEMVASMQYLKPTNRFELDMTNVAYPRQFPIDNETARDVEDGVGFEDHVLLNHLLKGFPTRGPVRHFMEMVMTGLSKNPHYTAQEKREHVQWYRDYFAQFSDEELQALPSTAKENKL